MVWPNAASAAPGDQWRLGSYRLFHHTVAPKIGLAQAIMVPVTHRFLIMFSRKTIQLLGVDHFEPQPKMCCKILPSGND